MTQRSGRISAVIPALNEKDELPVTLRRIRRVPEISEVIIADGGSSDGTRKIADEHACRLVTSEPGRGIQLHDGCSNAREAVILMLHADTWIEPDVGAAILDSLENPGVVGGGLWKRFRGRNLSWMMAGGELRCWLRMKLFSNILGDQGIFVRRDVLERIGGVPKVPLMEEFELCKKLRREGRLVLADSTVTTSTRKFQQLGVFKTYRLMWLVTLKYHLGVPLEELRDLYQGK